MKHVLAIVLGVFSFLHSFAQADDGDKKKPAILSNLTYLNAANFNFNEQVKGSYLGKLNIFSESKKNYGWGFIAGIMRVKFNYNDSISNFYAYENRLINPLDSVLQNQKYLREFNKYSSSRSNTVWSFYMQPMFCINQWYDNDKNEGLANGIYIHAHAELLVNRTSVSTAISNIQRDTTLIDTAKDINYGKFQLNPIVNNRTFLNGYFGVGITLNVDPFRNGHSRFFFQPTIGWTTNSPNWTSQDIESTNVNPLPAPTSTRRGSNIPVYRSLKSKGFYLVRAEFSQILSDNAQLMVGTDIRGLFPKYNPLYAAYIGINVNLDAVAKLVADKKD